MTAGAWILAAILLPGNPTAVEKSAADELKAALAKIGGGAVERTFYVGATAASRRVFGEDPKWKLDELGVGTDGGAIVLDGHPVRGVLYAVYDFLERDCGVRWWTSEASLYPELRELPVPARRRSAPSFVYREPYYLDGFDPVFKARCRVNFTSVARYEPATKDHRHIPAEMGGDYRFYFYEGRRSAYHSFFEVLPPSKHFKDHPEWYSLVDGKRVPRQLCLTNEEMAREYVAETLRRLRASPESDFIQVSQNDQSDPCACERCRAVEAEEGGAHAGPLLRFVNRVAAAVGREFPDVKVDTFAYQYTRRAPTRTRPAPNVTVRLCDIECAFNRPLADPGAPSENAAFVRDLRDWAKIAAGQLYVWDYVADFHSYMMPHPNHHVLADNLRLFRDAGAIGVFEQGDAGCSAGEFVPLRLWIEAHLLWNVDADAAALRREFLAGYYGSAAAPVLGEYIDLLSAAGHAAAGKVDCYHEGVGEFLGAEKGLRAWGLMQKALAAAEADGDECVRRVRRESLSADHMLLRHAHEWSAWCAANGRAWPVDAAFRRRWVEDCRAAGVVAWRESVKPNFDEYAVQILGVAPRDDAGAEGHCPGGTLR